MLLSPTPSFYFWSFHCLRLGGRLNKTMEAHLSAWLPVLALQGPSGGFRNPHRSLSRALSHRERLRL